MIGNSIRALLAGILVAAATGSAWAAGPYVGFGGGLSHFHDADIHGATVVSSRNHGSAVDGTVDYNSGYGYRAAVGYDLDPVRLEFEYGYRKADMDAGDNGSDSKLGVTSYMVNGYYDIKTGTAVTPYVGAGVGLLHGSLDLQVSPLSFHFDTSAFGYQVTAGTAFAVDRNIALEIGYTFQGAGSDFSKNGVKLAYMSSNFFAGIRYSFR